MGYAPYDLKNNQKGEPDVVAAEPFCVYKLLCVIYARKEEARMLRGVKMSTNNNMTRTHNPILPHKVFLSVLNGPKAKYDAKRAKKEAIKALRKQGFLVF